MLIEGLRWWEMERKAEMVEEEEDEGSRQSETEKLKEEGGGAYFVDVIAVEAISCVCVSTVQYPLSTH